MKDADTPSASFFFFERPDARRLRVR